MITVKQLIEIGVKPNVATDFHPHLVETFNKFEINTPKRQAAFLAQVCHESSFLTRLSENLNYSYDRIIESIPKIF